MDIVPLPVKLIRQDPSSDDCGRCCSLMILNFLGDPITQEEVWRKLHVYQKHSGLYGSYFSDIGKFALSRGHKAVIHHYDWHWWDKATVAAVTKGKTQLLKALEILRRHKKNWGKKKEISKEIAFVKKGGLYKIELPNLATIDFYLKQYLPVLLAVRSEELYHDPKENYSHFIVVIGKRDTNYLIKDPYLAIEEVSADELLYAWLRNGGWSLVIVPPRKEEAQLSLFKAGSAPKI